MSLREDLKEEMNEMKKNLKEIEEQSIAMEFIKDYKLNSKRFFIAWIVTFIAFIGLLSYTIYLLNDTTVVETSEETYNMSTEDGNNNYIGGDNNGEINNN